MKIANLVLIFTAGIILFISEVKGISNDYDDMEKVYISHIGIVQYANIKFQVINETLNDTTGGNQTEPPSMWCFHPFYQCSGKSISWVMPGPFLAIQIVGYFFFLPITAFVCLIIAKRIKYEGFTLNVSNVTFLALLALDLMVDIMLLGPFGAWDVFPWNAGGPLLSTLQSCALICLAVTLIFWMELVGKFCKMVGNLAQSARNTPLRIIFAIFLGIVIPTNLILFMINDANVISKWEPYNNWLIIAYNIIVALMYLFYGINLTRYFIKNNFSGDLPIRKVTVILVVVTCVILLRVLITQLPLLGLVNPMQFSWPFVFVCTDLFYALALNILFIIMLLGGSIKDIFRFGPATKTAKLEVVCQSGAYSTDTTLDGSSDMSSSSVSSFTSSSYED